MELIFDYNYKKYSDEIRSLYLEAFPKHERRSFTQLNKILKEKKCQIISILYKTKFAGFFILLKNKEATLIDYFAIKKQFRGKQIGTKALSKLDTGNPLIIEIEPIDENSSNNIQRVKRKSFYENLGFKSNQVLIDWYDTSFELMSLNDSKGIKNYFTLLDEIFTKEERMKYISIAE